MKLRIEKPDWGTGYFIPLEFKDNWEVGKVIQGVLCNWFNEHIEPINTLLENGVEISGFHETDFDKPFMNWSDLPYNPKHDTHSALLINVQEIKKDTAEDIIRDIVKDCDNNGIKNMETYYQRAKRVLDGG